MRFFDTNILIYAASWQDERKKKIAMDLLNHALQVNHDGCISSQVVNEFCSQMLGKLKMSREVVDGFLDVFRPLQGCDVTYDLVRHAVMVQEECQLSYWDALIVSAAERCHCHEIVTEDLNDGQLYRGMRAVNPFKE
ncbi:MAG: PIN domain-containing protein [Kiritimatiellae bacterium]|nr:PIN domain-containing protein [Kiritimatiellia bacterium]